MSGLLEVADVHRGDGDWTSGLEVEGLQGAMSSALASLCLPGPANGMGGSGSALGGGPTGYALRPFGVIVRLVQPNRCRTQDPDKAVSDATDSAVEKAAGRALWWGTGDADLWLGAPGAGTVAIDKGVGDTLKAWYDRTVGVDPVIHLGMQAAADFSQYMTDGRFNAYPDIPVVVNSSYPAGGLAVTGPIEVYIGSVETVQAHDIKINREDTEAAVLAAVAFDPYAVVVRGNLPDQVYISTGGPLTISVLVKGSSTAAAVAWGDATADGSVNPDSSASHTYAAAGTFTVTVTSEYGATTYTITV